MLELSLVDDRLHEWLDSLASIVQHEHTIMKGHKLILCRENRSTNYRSKTAGDVMRINPLRQRIHFLKEESSSFPFGPQDEVLYLVGDLDSNRHLCHILCSGSVFR